MNDPRALAHAALLLESRVGVPINYEDVPYLFRGDIVDLAAKLMTPRQKTDRPSAQILTPRGGILSVSLPIAGIGSASASSISSLLDALVLEHQKRGYPGTYSISNAEGSSYITPIGGLDVSGAFITVKPVLDSPVSLAFQERTAGDTLEAILKQVAAAAGVKVNVGAVPVGAMVTKTVVIGASNESARITMSRLLASLGTIRTGDGSIAPAFAYHLYFDPGSRAYYLNVHPVGGAGR